jgi:Ca2+-binding RTX toxin-like protein
VGLITTNDVPGCPHGGLLSGTDKADDLDGMDGDDEIHGLDGEDYIDGGLGNNVIYGGPGNTDESLSGDEGDDVIYGGDGNDFWLLGRAGEDVLYGRKGNDGLDATTGESEDGQRDQLYCGPGKDEYTADKLDYVDSSCEKKVNVICCGA